MDGSRRSLRYLLAIIALLVAVLAIFVPASAAEDEVRLGNTVPGAPFVPDTERSATVLDRTALVRSIADVEAALAQLQSDLPDSTIAILEAERSALQTRLAELSVDEMMAETAQFGIGLAVFPVEELRKPLNDGWHEPRPGGRRHKGTDVLAHYGVPLLAIEDSTVEQIKSSRVGGRTIYLIGDSGSRYYYAHMDEIRTFEPGDRVLAGDEVGTVGDTGNATGIPHLHLQWDPDGGSDWKNPYPLLAVLFDDGSDGPFEPPGQAR